jgi:hypothetical protein
MTDSEVDVVAKAIGRELTENEFSGACMGSNHGLRFMKSDERDLTMDVDLREVARAAIEALDKIRSQPLPVREWPNR